VKTTSHTVIGTDIWYKARRRFSAVDTVARETVASSAQKLGCGGRVVSIRFDMRAPVRGAAVTDIFWRG
jgi:hypothetical protein